MSIHLNQSPRSITESSRNESNSAGHSHAIEKASVTQAGIVKLVDNLDSKSKTEALTANQGRELAERLSLLAQSNGSKEINERLESALSYLATRYTAAYATYETAKANLCKHPENSLIYMVNDPTTGNNGLWTVVGGKLVKAPWDALSSALTSEPFEVLQSILQGAAGEQINYEGKTYDTIATFTQTLADGKRHIQDALTDLAESMGKFQEEVNSDVQESLEGIYKHGAALPYNATMEYAEGAVVVKEGKLQQKQGDSWVNVGASTVSALNRKKWLAIGDSITAFGMDNSLNKSYVDVLAERHGAILSKYATSGAWISTGTGVISIPNILSQTYTSLSDADNYDLITIAAGTNDRVNVTEGVLGEFTDRTTATFYGGLHTLIAGLKSKYPNARMLFISQIPRSGLRTNIASPTALDLKFKAIVEVCDYYSVPVWAGHKEFGFHPDDNSTFKSAYMPDGLHPSDRGHLWFANRVEQAILSCAR